MITGAGRGIGLALARICLERGDRVVATSRRPSDALAALAAAHGPALVELRLDVADEAGIVEARRALEDRVDVIDLLLNNAGMYSRLSDHWDADATTFDAVTQSELVEVFRVNAAGPMLVTLHFLNLVRASRRGRILNLSSLLGSVSARTGGGDYAYAASKAALNIMTRALAAELAPGGLIAIAITPGWVRTTMGGTNASLSPEESARGILKVAEKLTMLDSGRFVDYQGEDQPW